MRCSRDSSMALPSSSVIRAVRSALLDLRVASAALAKVSSFCARKRRITRMTHPSRAAAATMLEGFMRGFLTIAGFALKKFRTQKNQAIPGTFKFERKNAPEYQLFGAEKVREPRRPTARSRNACCAAD